MASRIRALQSLRTRSFGFERARFMGRRWNSQESKPKVDQVTNAPNPHRQFYKSFAFPVLKVVLGSMFVYQVLYWTWLKLEATEEAENKDKQIDGLKKDLIDAVKTKVASEKK